MRGSDSGSRLNDSSTITPSRHVGRLDPIISGGNSKGHLTSSSAISNTKRNSSKPPAGKKKNTNTNMMFIPSDV